MIGSKITLVGAGPGDPELLTIKAMRAIQNADAILYDALSNEELLSYAPAGCFKLYVGKRRGCKSNKQEAINELIVHCAKKYGHVVRLKGGDPFVFGRGQEEIEYANAHGIPTTVIPGISSCISVPALEGIPLTTRGINESFWVTTGTLSSGEISPDIKFAAQSSATVVILMGLHRIEEIMSLFQTYAKSDTPVAVIQNGSLESKKMVIGQVGNITDKVLQEQIASPAIIVVGDVVALSPNYIKEMVYQELVKS
jgi:uroporphyrin-III C-methyltransferase